MKETDGIPRDLVSNHVGEEGCYILDKLKTFRLWVYDSVQYATNVESGDCLTSPFILLIHRESVLLASIQFERQSHGQKQPFLYAVEKQA
jgi:hypothetical protein